MPASTQPARRSETPRSIALSRHRSPSRWLGDGLRHGASALPWPSRRSLAPAIAALLALLLL